MKKLFKIFAFPFKAILYLIIYTYKAFISPLLPKTCRYYPTCSSYALQAIGEFGVIKGTFLSVKRILRCNPRHRCGFDPVPSNIKGDIKWLI